MSKVFIRSLTSNVWVPLSAPDATPNLVNAQTLGGVWKSIGGIADPPAERRKIRNAANSGWVDLDTFPVKDPPVAISALYRNNSNARAPAGSVAGDLIVVFAYDNTISAVTFSSTMMTLIYQVSANRANMAVFAFINDGVTNKNWTWVAAGSGARQISYGVRITGAGIAGVAANHASNGFGVTLSAFSANPAPSANNLGLSFFGTETQATGGFSEVGGVNEYPILNQNAFDTLNPSGMVGSLANVGTGADTGVAFIEIPANRYWGGLLVTVAPS